MDLVKVYKDDKAVTELVKVSEYFNKRHDHLLRDIRNLLDVDHTLDQQFIATTYTNVRGKTYPTFYVTKEGFYLLVSSFTTKRAIKWKREFFKQYEEMEQHIKQLQDENRTLLEFAKLVLGKTDSPNLRSEIIQGIKQLQDENHLILNEHEDYTYCVSDVCCKFKGLDPVTANNILVDKNIIQRRASGYYPTIDYISEGMLVSATCVGVDGFINYVRYTPKGVIHICNVFKDYGFEEVL